MCTLIGKKTSSKLIVIKNTPCCLFVEDIQELVPKISRENGWEEIDFSEIYGELPEWTHWTNYKEKFSLPDDLPRMRPDGKRLVFIELDEKMNRHLRFGHQYKPFAKIVYRNATIHFRNLEQIKVMYSYISDKLRKLSNYPIHTNFIRMIPTTFLRNSNRDKVLKILNKLIKTHS